MGIMMGIMMGNMMGNMMGIMMGIWLGILMVIFMYELPLFHHHHQTVTPSELCGKDDLFRLRLNVAKKYRDGESKEGSIEVQGQSNLFIYQARGV